MRQQTASHVSLADTVQEAAPRVSVLVTVLLVGIPLARLVQVQQRLTASHVVPVAMVLAAAPLASALVTVH